MTVRAKFTVIKSAEMGYAGADGPTKYTCYTKDGLKTEDPVREITMSAVCGGSEENKSFVAVTPTGSIVFQLNNPDVAEEFQVGTTYYVTFDKA